MGDADDGHSTFVEGFELLFDDSAGVRVERRGGFVAEQNVGFRQEKSNQGDPLLLPDGQVGGFVLEGDVS